jgi:small redox-active disulfide protein 2
MKKIQILGPGCPKCKKLEEETRIATYELGLECHIEKVTDIQKISSYGVIITPALVVDGQVKITGKVPSKKDIMKMLM